MLSSSLIRNLAGLLDKVRDTAVTNSQCLLVDLTFLWILKRTRNWKTAESNQSAIAYRTNRQ